MKYISLKILITLFPLFFSPGIIIAAELLSESFNDCGEPIPAGWEAVNLGGDCRWIFNSDRENETGGQGCYAIADSDACGSGTSMETALITPSIDCSASHGTILSFAYDAFHQKDGSANFTDFTVQLSLNSGIDWTDIWKKTASDRGPKTATVDISAEADGQPSVQIRFHYRTDAWDWWWQIDDVKVSSSDESDTFNWLLFLPAIMSGSQRP